MDGMIDLDKPVRVRLLDGKERTLRYRMSSCRRIDEVSGRDNSILQGALLSEPVTPRTLTILLWGGLVHEEPGLTIEQVEDLVHPSQVEEIRAAITLAWIGDHKPKPQEDADAGPPTAPPSNP